MKVMINGSNKYKAKYIPLLKGKYQCDYDINAEIMPPILYLELFVDSTKKVIETSNRVLWFVPVGVNEGMALLNGCTFVKMLKKEYLKVAHETREGCDGTQES